LHTKKETLDKSSVSSSCSYVRLASRDGAHGASVGAAAAIQASTGIDLVMISTLSDGANGAALGASAAADASVTDNICHGKTPP
jgi:hypothetical protein